MMRPVEYFIKLCLLVSDEKELSAEKMQILEAVSGESGECRNLSPAASKEIVYSREKNVCNLGENDPGSDINMRRHVTNVYLNSGNNDLIEAVITDVIEAVFNDSDDDTPDASDNDTGDEVRSEVTPHWVSCKDQEEAIGQDILVPRTAQQQLDDEIDNDIIEDKKEANTAAAVILINNTWDGSEENEREIVELSVDEASAV